MKKYYLLALSELLLVPVKKTDYSYEVTNDIKYIDNKYALLFIDNEYNLINILTKEVVLKENIRFVLNDIAVLADGRLYDLESNVLIDTENYRYYETAGDVIELTCGIDRMIRFYNTKEKKLIKTNNGLSEIRGVGDSCQVLKSGKYALVGHNGVSELWDLASGEIIHTFHGKVDLYKDCIKSSAEGLFRIDPYGQVMGVNCKEATISDNYLINKVDTINVYKLDSMELVASKKTSLDDEVEIVNNHIVVSKKEYRGISYVEDMDTKKRKNFFNKKLIVLSNQYIGVKNANGNMAIYDMINNFYLARFKNVMWAEVIDDFFVITENDDKTSWVFSPISGEQTKITCSLLDMERTDKDVMLFRKNCDISYLYAPSVARELGVKKEHYNMIIDLYETPELEKEEETTLKRTK